MTRAIGYLDMRTRLLLTIALALPGVASATPASNGIYVNTTALNGIYVNGIYVNGIYVNGRDMSHGQVTAAVFGDETIAGVKPWQAYKPDHYLHYPHVDGTGLAGWAWEWSVGGWVWRSGEWFEGTIMPIGIHDQATNATEVATARIVDVLSHPDAAMLLHTVEIQAFDVDGVEHWEPMCGKDEYGSPVPAIALRGEWDAREGSFTGGDQISDSPYRVTFACSTGALGKCAAACTNDATCKLLGVPTALKYQRWVAPYQQLVDGTAMWRDYALDHQACTRMVRADYCGDGRSWTAPGTPIDVYDRTRVNVATKATSSHWMYEATWNENGAVRISCDRLYEGPVSCPNPARPWELYSITTSYSCYASDGLANAAARLGNLRQKTISLPPPLPFRP